MSRYAEYFPPSRPRQAKGGIRAQSRRGAFVKTWWGRRWLEVLDSFDIGARLARGRGYARKGQVLDLVINSGKVLARVQGSRRVPYKVLVALKPIAAALVHKSTGVGTATGLTDGMAFGYRGGSPAQEPACHTKPKIPAAINSRRLAIGSRTGQHTMRRCGTVAI